MTKQTTIVVTGALRIKYAASYETVSSMFAKMTFKNHKQMTKQTTIVVAGALRI